MIRLEDVTLTVGNRELLEHADLHVHPGDHVGLVGPNGAGKTSLLRLIVGELEPEAGRVVRRSGATLGYLPQQAVSGSEATVWDEAASGMVRMRALQARVEAAQAAVEAGEAGAVERLGDAVEALRLAGGYAVEERIGEVLHGLGFKPDAWTRPCSTFSGGWQMRIALARLLLSEADVLILDEPSNHLDLLARSWLARFLAEHPGTTIVVSHDRHLLDTATTRTVEIRHHGLEAFKGNLTAWLEEKARRDALLEATAARQAEEASRLERFVERFGAKATKAAAAKSKQKQLDRMERVELPEAERRPRLRLPEAPGCSRDAIVLQRVAVGWPDGPTVISGVDLVLERGQRWVVLGPNGTGKSTLLHALAGTLPAREGRRRVGKDVRIGVFRQDLAAELPPDTTPLDHVLAQAPSALPQRARAALGALGLHGDMALRPIGSLSGGERARVVLAAFALQPYNVLLLDEPTNHLDVVTVDVLVEALERFEGALVIVTHDRWLVERVATHVVTVAGGAVTLHEGVRPSDLEPARAVEPEAAATAPSEAAEAHQERKERKRERQKAQRRYDALAAELGALEARLAELDEQLFAHAADFARAAALGVARDDAERRMEAVFEELAALEDELAG